MNKDLKILINFLNDYKIYKSFVFVVLALVTMFAYVEVTAFFDEIELLKNIGNFSKKDECVKLLMTKSAKILGVYIVVYLLPIISDYFLTKCYRICICFYILKALNLNQATYYKIGPSSIRSIIDRKVFHYVHGFHLLLFSFSYNLSFAISVIVMMYIYFNIYLTLYSLSALVTVVSLTVPITKFRNVIRNKYTEKYDKVIKNLYRIIYNYDIIKATNNESKEIEIFDTQLRNIRYYGIFSAFLSSFGGFINRSVVIIPNGFIFYLMLKKNAYLDIKNAAEFILFNKLFCELKSKFNHLKTHYTMLSQYYTDIRNNDWDEIRYDIENMEMYFEYKHTDNRDIEVKNIEQTVEIKDQKPVLIKNISSRDIKDFDIIKKTIIETQKVKINGDGREKFVLNEHIKFQDFVLCIEDRILTNPANFTIKKGEKVGLVGKNGVGKSTLVNVFLRYRDYKGSLFIDNQEMRNIYKIDQRDKISFVPQIPGILSGTITDNLLYNSQNLSETDILKLCTLYDMNFKDLNRDVGDNGKFLSGGEKQRMSFLRGVIKNGDIFILDEPTANMDPKSELNLIDKMHTYLSDKTVIAIIHKHVLLEKFDKILGIYNNEIMVYDSYKEFLKESHLY
ncbi:ABC transporter (ATM1-type) [Vairimorpha necatrix]|uniref:ABC transporter (ATM1-type) n=1 Tax=Vairimorpha necatrix TaxID=6039 RepID=A0AAX4JCI4_9MICR